MNRCLPTLFLKVTPMTLNQLRYFMTLAQCLNFSRAAQMLYVSQPTLSYQISELEKDLGAQLFVRDKRKVFLTHAGKQIIDRVKLVLETVDDIAESMQEFSAEMDKPKSVSLVFDDADERFESLGISEKIAHFMREYPEVSVSIDAAPFQTCIERLKNGEVDIAVLSLRANDTPDTEINIYPLMEDRFGLVYAKELSVASPQELFERLPLLYSEGVPRARLQVENGLQLNNISCRMKRAASFNTSLVQAECGQGIIAMPQHMYDYYFFDRFNFMPLEYDWARIALCLCWNISNMNTAIQHVINEFN